MKIHLEFDDKIDNLKQIAPLLRAVADDATKIDEPPLTDAEIGEAQANVASHLKDALLTLAFIPDLTNVEEAKDREYLAGALYALALAGEQAQRVLAQYGGDRRKIAVGGSLSSATILKAAAKAALDLHPELTGGSDALPHSNS